MGAGSLGRMQAVYQRRRFDNARCGCNPLQSNEKHTRKHFGLQSAGLVYVSARCLPTCLFLQSCFHFALPEVVVGCTHRYTVVLIPAVDGENGFEYAPAAHLRTKSAVQVIAQAYDGFTEAIAVNPGGCYLPLTYCTGDLSRNRTSDLVPLCDLALSEAPKAAAKPKRSAGGDPGDPNLLAINDIIGDHEVSCDLPGPPESPSGQDADTADILNNESRLAEKCVEVMESARHKRASAACGGHRQSEQVSEAMLDAAMAMCFPNADPGNDAEIPQDAGGVEQRTASISAVDEQILDLPLALASVSALHPVTPAAATEERNARALLAYGSWRVEFLASQGALQMYKVVPKCLAPAMLAGMLVMFVLWCVDVR